MKIKFKYIFLAASWVIYFATGKGAAGSALLVFSGLYLMCDTLYNWERKDG